MKKPLSKATPYEKQQHLKQLVRKGNKMAERQIIKLTGKDIDLEDAEILNNNVNAWLWFGCFRSYPYSNDIDLINGSYEFEVNLVVIADYIRSVYRDFYDEFSACIGDMLEELIYNKQNHWMLEDFISDQINNDKVYLKKVVDDADDVDDGVISGLLEGLSIKLS